MIAFITGSGFYDYPGTEKETLTTPYGMTEIFRCNDSIILPRHGENHKYLPHHINYRANIQALKDLKVDAIVSFSVVGVIDPHIPLGQPLLVNDLYYPENRLPNGEMCSFFNTPGQKDRGHLIASSLFHSELSTDICSLLENHMHFSKAVYGHVNSPRFNTKTEIHVLKHAGVDIVSQTCGPEAVLANELEIPYALLTFSVDYANGVGATPASIQDLNQNLEKSLKLFQNVIEMLPQKRKSYSFENFIYRFE